MFLLIDLYGYISRYLNINIKCRYITKKVSKHLKSILRVKSEYGNTALMLDLVSVLSAAVSFCLDPSWYKIGQHTLSWPTFFKYHSLQEYAATVLGIMVQCSYTSPPLLSGPQTIMTQNACKYVSTVDVGQWHQAVGSFRLMRYNDTKPSRVFVVGASSETRLMTLGARP